MSLVYLCHFLLLCINIFMYVKRHEQSEIGCGAILNKIYYQLLDKLVLVIYLQFSCKQITLAQNYQH